jgi:hypothetical protein
LSTQPELNQNLIDQLWDMDEHWKRKKACASGELKNICEHAIERIELLLDYIEGLIH